jgi:pilus assembly protein Flp/PilA
MVMPVSVLPEGTPEPELMLWKPVIGRVVMKNLVARFAKDESGATAIEYGLIAAGIGVAIVTVVGEVGTELNTMFGEVKTGLQ